MSTLFYEYMCLARVCFCVVERVALHSTDSLDDGCQIGVIGYALNGLTNQFLRMSPRFTTRSKMLTNLGRTSSPARNAAETTL